MITRRSDWLLAIVLAMSAACATAQSEKPLGYTRFMQGPMVGNVTGDQITIWGRLNGPYTAEIEYATSADFENSRRVSLDAQKEDDYALRWTLRNLEPDTRYYYRFKVAGGAPRYQRDLSPFHTRTGPAPGKKGVFHIAFGSCPRFQLDREQHIWTTIEQHRPDLFFWVGDNIYGDSTDPAILAEEYRRQRDVPALQPLQRTVPQLATWDDHDFGINDYDRRHPRKQGALEVFKRYWANPAYGLPQAPGVFFRYHYGGVDFFFLDVRYYRDPNAEPDLPGKTLLGEAQLQWLRQGLKNSEAPFKVLISGSGWTKAKGPGGDSWSSFLHERYTLFEFIRQQDISGVVFVSGDVHKGELNAIPWSEKGGYDFFELVSSPLGQTPVEINPQMQPEVRLRPVFSRENNFGFIEFDLREEPTLRFSLIGSSGRLAWEPLEIQAKELVNGVASWRSKVLD